jgi:hydrogenase expression/formation protein HypD
MHWEQFKKPLEVERIVKSLGEMKLSRKIKIMEICGTHTMSIARAGIKGLLPDNIKLISGPGCPVCVTPAERIDRILELAPRENLIIATYGDMLKVPGSKQGESLERYKALGADVRMVYSASDAVELAEENPGRDVVFLGIGFETTTPGTSLAIERAIQEGVNNFYIFSMHKLVEPILRALMTMEDFDIDGFICPGHVSIILGEKGFEFLSKEFNIPSIITGFEAGDLLTAIYRLSEKIVSGDSSLENEYKRVVSREGNIRAQESIFKYFEICDDLWRGIGTIKGSGLRLKKEYEAFDAVKKFNIKLSEDETITACKCGEVIKGKQEPLECQLFNRLCTPENPVGPCMVSSEGACAAYYKYQL